MFFRYNCPLKGRLGPLLYISAHHKYNTLVPWLETHHAQALSSITARAGPII